METGFTHYADRQEREVTATELARNNIYGPPPFKTALPLTMVLVSPAHLPPAPVQKYEKGIITNIRSSFSLAK